MAAEEVSWLLYEVVVVALLFAVGCGRAGFLILACVWCGGLPRVEEGTSSKRSTLRRDVKSFR